uniref:Uncharacterized protein n=1 Tax=Lygus hesperus TaxID=30085 RepID=A0A0A9Z4J8_LYGHE
MSTPKKAKITPKYEKPVEKETVVEPAALLAVASPHLIELAKPVFRDYSTHKKKTSKGKGGKRGRRKRREKTRRSPEIREAWLAKNAAPKKWPPPAHIHPHKQRFIMRGSTKTLIKERKRFTIPLKPPMKITKSELYRRCVYLSIPSKRREKFKWYHERDDFTERRQKKLAQHPTETIRKLALPKPIPPEAQLDLKFKSFKINKGALHYKATERIVTLATPIQKQARVDSDIKENPFGVVKRALKAICSKRVAELAQPVMRD